MSNNTTNIDKSEAFGYIFALMIEEGWTYQISKTDNKSDFTEEKIFTIETVESDELIGNKWIRLKDGHGQAIQLNISELKD